VLVEQAQLKTASLQDLIKDANAAVPDLFARRENWLAQNRAVNRGAH
jgi:hypothetical protein